ncbi:trypsin-like serine protease [Clostridium manihotivorum]|uniref:Peptidase S1 domain-containing protein n=1 Tax=Clostridium manihotivorum TaxID=2320868 RepID=A0A3R5X1P4_9CLOT|nr:trypsin-like serine protease [Clostridium manihotivorum]QAA32173.1 hypothetical protein C1I91_11220 [Clostridium manihotivorum]
MRYDEDVKYLSVRLEIERASGEQESIGSGILWTPSKSNEYTYIFTAAHVVNDYLDEDVKFGVRYYDVSGVSSYERLEKENIEVHMKYIKRNDNFERDINDIAVIRCKKINCKKISYNFLNPINVKKESKLIFNGFPKKLSDLEFEINCNEYMCHFDSVINESETFKYKLDIENALDVSMKNDDLLGVSGSGVFLKNGSSISLIGIHTHGVGEDVTMNMAIGMSIKLILDICFSRGWEYPIISVGNINNYEDYISDLSINNKKLLDDINYISRDIIDVENKIIVNIENILIDERQYILLDEPGSGKSCVIESLCYKITKSTFNKIPIILKLQGYGLYFKDIREGILKILSQYNELFKIDEVDNLIRKGLLYKFQ